MSRTLVFACISLGLIAGSSPVLSAGEHRHDISVTEGLGTVASRAVITFDPDVDEVDGTIRQEGLQLIREDGEAKGQRSYVSNFWFWDTTTAISKGFSCYKGEAWVITYVTVTYTIPALPFPYTITHDKDPQHSERRYSNETLCIEAPLDPDPGSGGPTVQPPEIGDEGNSPIIVDLSDNGYSLTGLDDAVLFDLDGDGSLERRSWTARGADDAFLWLDENGDGLVNNGRELFGDAVFANGFIKLSAFDQPALEGNGDGLIDERDEIWDSLLLWNDTNHDGISQPEEIVSLSSTPIIALELRYRTIGKQDEFGNEFRLKAKLYRVDEENRIKMRHYYDIYFLRE